MKTTHGFQGWGGDGWRERRQKINSHQSFDIEVINAQKSRSEKKRTSSTFYLSNREVVFRVATTPPAACRARQQAADCQHHSSGARHTAAPSFRPLSRRARHRVDFLIGQLFWLKNVFSVNDAGRFRGRYIQVTIIPNGGIYPHSLSLTVWQREKTKTKNTKRELKNQYHLHFRSSSNPLSFSLTLCISIRIWQCTLIAVAEWCVSVFENCSNQNVCLLNGHLTLLTSPH